MAKEKKQPEAYELCHLERFVRILKHKRGPGDHFDGFQPEIVWVSGDKVIKRTLVDKPNVFEHAYSHAADLIDPRNEMPEAEE